MIEFLFLQKFEVFFGLVYLYAIYKHQSKTKTNTRTVYVWMQNLALSTSAENYLLGGY